MSNRGKESYGKSNFGELAVRVENTKFVVFYNFISYEIKRKSLVSFKGKHFTFKGKHLNLNR